MEIDVNDQKKQVLIWLSKAESRDEALKKSLKPLYQKYKAMKYLVAVYHSGTEDLEELTRDLVLYNRVRLRELEKQKERAEEKPSVLAKLREPMPAPEKAGKAKKKPDRDLSIS